MALIASNEKSTVAIDVDVIARFEGNVSCDALIVRDSDDVVLCEFDGRPMHRSAMTNAVVSGSGTMKHQETR